MTDHRLLATGLPPRRRQRGLAGRLLGQPRFVAGAVLVVLFVGIALLAEIWTPWPVEGIFMKHRLLPPSLEHWLGTDPLGRDIASLLMAGAASSLLAGAISVSLGLLAGALLGLLAAMRGGWLDEIIMRAADFSFAFPAILLATILAAASESGPGLDIAILAIALAMIPTFTRVTRASAGIIWQMEYIAAARAAGRSEWHIALRHVLPNLASPLIVQATLQFSIAILAESALSYLGLGVQPPAPSWGRMLSEAQSMIFTAPELAFYPGAAIVLAVMGLNLLGDGLRDALDPRLAPVRRRPLA